MLCQIISIFSDLAGVYWHWLGFYGSVHSHAVVRHEVASVL